MNTSWKQRRMLAAGASWWVLAALAAPPARAEETAVAIGAVAHLEELVVTAERREAPLQRTPLAISAFTGEALQAARLDGPQDLLQATPNLNYSRSNFGAYNLSIRGVGSKFTGMSGEFGVSVHVNDTPLTFSRLADAQFYDIERVEVLRGPQGALYGHNATGGTVNFITRRPTDRFEGYVTAEYANYDSIRLQGALNLPLNDIMALRLAGFRLKRDGFVLNTYTGRRVDDRDIAATRLSFRLRPNTAFDLNLMWERFDEKDSRSRIGKQLCIHDPGPGAIGAVPVLGANRDYLSQGCLAGSRYAPAAFGAPNTVATLAGLYLPLVGLAQGDLFAGKVQDHDLRRIESARDPVYSVRTDFYQIDARLRLTPELTLQSLTGFNYDRAASFQDYNRIVPDRTFTPAGPAALLFPAGYVDDPQLGRANTLLAFDYFPTQSKGFSQELRLSSDFGGAFDFTLGALHRESEASSRYFVLSNGLTAFAQLQDVLAGAPGVFPFYVDPNSTPDASGHSYYVNQSVNRARSTAVFGEVIWRATESLKLTAGLRLTHGRKESEPSPVTLLAQPFLPATPPAAGLSPNPAFNGGRGLPPAPLLTSSDRAPTGRLNLQWTPQLAFTDTTMIYASYSRGYKGGGFNTPCDIQSPGCGSVPRTFEPERVDAYEIGAKNMLAQGRLALNLSAFLYDYAGYQVSATVNKGAVNQNLDAEIYGLEVEAAWEPIRDLRFNLAGGWLKTRIHGGAVIDTLDRTQGDPALAVVKAQDGSNCVVNRTALATLVAIQQGLPGAPRIPGVTGNPAALLAACSGLYSALGLYSYSGRVVTAPTAVNNAPAPNTLVQVGQGVPVALRGRRLPNAPEWTLSLGGQYGWDLAGWRATLRGDYYRQGDSYARIFNSETDRLRGYQIVNASLTLAHRRGLEVQLFGKNLGEATPITDFSLADDSSGLFTNTFTLEPRTWGVAVTQRF